MNINWKLRLKNKATLTALIMCIIAMVYQVLGIVGVVPTISQDDIVNLAGVVINFFTLIGVVVDPTTSGVSDSTRAMQYTEPNAE